MIHLALALLFSTLWTILAPFSLTLTITVNIFFILSSFILSLIFAQYRAHLLLWSAGIIMGTLITSFPLKNYQNAITVLPTEGYFSIKVLNIHPKNESITAKIIDSKEHSLNGMSVFIRTQTPLILGEHYQVALKLSALNTPQMAHDQNKRLFYLSRHLVGAGKATSEFTKITDNAWITNLRLSIDQYFKSDQNYSHSSYLSALSVGITDDFSEEDWQTLRRTGTIHLVSISGLHLTFLALWGFIIIRTIAGLMLIQRPAPFEIAAAVSLIIVLFYALLAGFSLPTQRALIMFSIAMITLCLRSPILSMQSLATALFIIVLLTPFSVLTIGFWLSFTAVCILIILARYKFSPFKLLIFTQITISLLVMPFTASYFGEVSLISPLANFFAIPWTMIFILPPLLIGICIMGVFPNIAHALFSFSNSAIELMLNALALLEQIPAASLSTPNVSFISALFITILGLICLLPNIKRKLFSAILLIILLGISMIPAKKIFSLHLFPVGEGLASVITTPKKSFVFDTGRYFRGFDSGTRVILPGLKALNIKEIETIMISKYNQQHTGGTRSIRQAFPDTKVVAPIEITDFIDNSIDCKNYHYSDQTISINPLDIHSSCAFEVKINQQRIWLIADITKGEWSRLIKNRPFPEVILFPNQGRTKGFDISSIQKERAHRDKPIILFSTKNISKAYQSFINLSKKNYSEPLNAYNGWIHIAFKADKITPIHYQDQSRYWWMKNKNSY